MLRYEVALLVFLVCFVLSRVIMMRAALRLSGPQQAALVETFALISRYALLPGVLLIAVYIFLSQGAEGEGRSLAVVFLALLGGAAAGMQIWIYRRIRALELESSYLRRFFLSRLVLLVGTALLLISVGMS